VIRKGFMVFFALCTILGIAGCTTAKSDLDSVETPLVGTAQLEQRKQMLEELNAQKEVYLKLMSHSHNLDELNRQKKELDRIVAEINRIEIEIPEQIPKSPEVKVGVSHEQDEIIKLKKERLRQLGLQQPYFEDLLKNAQSDKEVTSVKEHLDQLQGEIEDLKEEIRVQELEDVDQNKFAVKHATVYGPIGIACKTLEILFKRLFILFEF